MANKSRSKSAEQQAVQYKNSKRWETNRLRKLLRAQKRNPENAQIELALKNINYRRNTPKTPFWSKQKIACAMAYKDFTGFFNKDIFSSNEKIALPALTTSGPKSVPCPQPGFFEKSMFQLGQRVPTWNLS